MDIKELATNYKIDMSGINVVKKSRTAFVVGITSAGKDTIVKRLLDTGNYHLIISHTTRQPRINNGVLEQDGIDYHFVSVDQMTKLLANHELIEVNCFGGNYYGVSITELEKANADGKIATSDIDINGISSFCAIDPESTVAIFVIPPSYDVWLARNKQRYASEDLFQKDWQIRRNIAIHELETALTDQHYFFIINDDLDCAVELADKVAHRDSEVISCDDSAARDCAKLLLAAIQQNY